MQKLMGYMLDAWPFDFKMAVGPARERERERMDIYAETCSKSWLFLAGQVVFEAGEKGAAV